MKSVLTTILLANAALAVPASAAWQRVGSLDKRPVDTASSSVPGSKIVSSQGVAQPENLLSDDVAVSSKLSAGASEIVLDTSRQVVVESALFVNEGAEGRASVASSMDKRSWTPLGQSVFTSADRSITMKFAGSQAKYVKVQWDLSKGGSIKSLNVFGSDNDYDFKVTEAAPNEPTTSVNIAGGIGGARVVYINPNPVRGDEIGTKYGRFEFPESPDKYRTVIYDFGQARTVSEIGSVHSPRPVRFSAYAFEKELPEKEDWRGRKSFDPTVFDSMKPIAQAEDARGVGYVKAKPSPSVRARYVALRWEPDFNPPSFVVEGVTIMAQVKAVTFQPGAGGPGSNQPNTNGDQNGNQNSGPNGGDSTATTGGAGPAMTPFTNPFTVTGVYAGAASNQDTGGQAKGNGKGNQGNGKGNGGPANASP